ncbi:5-oxopent-3-ene-1,2,5-tricarboxylate decarboxylase [Chthoniobacter flavus Ellin428]|uniref:5-oxopent-3-ene-1,2,5-tricarboxylate decarboxylase n=1 Tax=Chthoniobacter flavus Ellin428 TaxID=497964 RepID=B4D5A9_9BACT|nr:fumarylacetoacetate hydrolase family protein [Chthoniobacter flavus]EDY18314.1 5-oxopent-3-ene-1,2,5-tricarboxylate decarboxylase [Chthoniobacter flavus Ellin428]TCO91340.1 2-keto-4-pentenoate hydratase/2-oxohepta-3-ene-1,7-dioic acid hydratase in catechol pathway [Chthoniobacter flavus]
MKIIRYQSPTGEIGYAQEHADGTATKLRGCHFDSFEQTGETAPVARLLAPLEPTAILCIGLNYRQHAIETNAPLPQYPVLFFKNPASVQHPGEPIVLPRWLASEKVDYECELAVIIGKRAKNVPRERALEYVFGYTCANDVSARDWQREGGGTQWCRGKSFDTFAPLGPRIVTRDEIPNPQALRIRTIVNGETLQNSSTGDMIFDVATLIEFLSGSTTLLPGTVILTGTPQGVGMAFNPPRFLKAGDKVTIDIENIGALSNPVIDETPTGATSFRL